MKIKTYFAGILVFCFLGATAAGELFAQQKDQSKDDRQQPSVKQEPAEEETNDAEKPAATDKKLLAIVGGDVHTVTGEVIRKGIILIEDGKIKAVGRNIDIPEGADVIDAVGQIVTPGFVAINMSGVGLRSAPTGNNKLEDSLDPFDRNIKYSLGVGITSGCIELSQPRRGRRNRSNLEENNLNDTDRSDIPEISLEELTGYDRREGEPEHRFPGIDLEIGDYVTEAQLDYGLENTSLCPCCNLPILPTEPITPAPPTEEEPRKHAAIKMSYGHLSDMLIKEDVFYSPAPGALSGALNRHNWRRDIKKARADLEKSTADTARRSEAQADSNAGTQRTGREVPARQRNSETRPGGTRGENTTLTPLLKKEVSMRITANTIDEIRDMIALAEELDYKLIVEGGIEAWLVASDLSKAGVPVIFTPRQRRAARTGEEQSSGSSIETTGLFEELGVPFAVASLSNSVSMGGLAGRDLTSLPLEAAFAVRGGASNRTALEAITIVPARMMGLDDRIGSIEVGKDADLLILNGEPLDYRTYVETAIVAGNICYERSVDRVYPVYERD